MKYLLLLASLAAGFIGFLVLAGATSATHEIESFILFLIATVLFTGAAIVESIDKASKKFNKAE